MIGTNQTKHSPQAALPLLAATLLLLATASAQALPAGAASAAPAAHVAPAASAASATNPHVHPSPRKAAKPAAPVHLVDINSASRTELKTLPGIGDAEADRIIAGRPYLTKTELVSKQVLPTGPYLALRKRIVAMQKLKSARKS